MTGVPLILTRSERNRRAGEPLSRLIPPRVRPPSVAIVYATTDGRLHLIDDGKPMKWTEALTSRFRTRYEVDLSDHVREVILQSTPPVAAGGVHGFRARLIVGFRVWDPVAIVRRNIEDALTVVHPFLRHVCREVASEYSIENPRGVEEAIHARFRSGEKLEEGIEIYMVRASILPDEAAKRYLDALVRARREYHVKRAEHRVNTETTARDNELALMRQSGDLERRLREHDVLATRDMSATELIRIHLERNPQDTERAMKLLGEAYQTSFDRHEKVVASDRDMLRFLVEKQLVRPSDITGLRDQAVTGLASGQPSSLTSTPAAAWDEPLPGSPARPVGNGPIPGLIPVYVLLDESLTAHLGDLEAALGALYDAILERPEIANVIRLSVLGVADDVDIVRALGTVERHIDPPRLRPGGPPRLSRAFEQLLHCIPHDTEALKAEHHSVRRPQVIVLSGGEPADDAAWPATHGRLVDRAGNRSAPDILALGVGSVRPRTILRIATRPDYAFVATTPDIAEAIEKFSAFIRTHVLTYGRAVIDGELSPDFPAPEGFHRAAETSATETS